MTTRSFPQGFLFGAATAGHQVEGDNTNSDTWFAEQVSPTVFKEPSGKACNSYELWREDVELAHGLGLSAYRFSVEWARVEPEEGTFDDDELAHYEAILDYCLELGLAPVVTFNHFTAPHWFAMRGGWLDPKAPELFARYCDRLMESFGDKIAYAVTMNEPNLARLLTWIGFPQFVRDLERATLQAASEATGVPAYRLANVMLPEDMDAMAEGMTAGHLAGKAAIKARRPDLPVGLSIAIVDDVVEGDDASVRDRKRAEVYDHWLRLAQGDDFVGVQNYERIRYDGDGPVPIRTACRATRWAAPSNRCPLPARSPTRSRSRRCRCSSPSTACPPTTTTCARDSSSRLWQRSSTSWMRASRWSATCTGRCSTTSSGSSATATNSACTPSTARPSSGRRSPAPPSTQASSGPTPSLIEADTH